MDISNAISGWASVAVTGIGLLSLVTQSTKFHSILDPFHESRNDENLGDWILVQERRGWFSVSRKPPLGPALSANLTHGLCGARDVYLTRQPLGSIGALSWTCLLACFHRTVVGSEEYPNINFVRTLMPYAHVTRRPWNEVSLIYLTKHGSKACIVVSRKVLIVFMILASAHQVWRFEGPSGYRAAFSSYNGLYNIDVPLGGEAIITFSALDYYQRDKDVQPRCFRRRVDHCINMLAGIVLGGDLLLAFPGREEPGMWKLEWQERGYAAYDGSRYLYSLMSGEDYKIHKLIQRRVSLDEVAHNSDYLKLDLPSLVADRAVHLYVPPFEQTQLAAALDHLPWMTLNWAMHRGMQDILTAYGKPTMDAYRPRLARTLQKAVREHQHVLVHRGWRKEYVREYMDGHVSAAILVDQGDSGDTVRLVTDVALMLWDGRLESELDGTRFWRDNVDDRIVGGGETTSWVEDVGCDEDVMGTSLAKEEGSTTAGTDDKEELTADTVIALVKYFVITWSHDFDYRIYHDFPVKMFMR